MKRRQIFRRTSALLAASCAALLSWQVWGSSGTLRRRKAIVRQVFKSATPAVFSAQHLLLLRQLRVQWLSVESGAPGIDPLQPLYGQTDAVSAAMLWLKTQDEALAVQCLAELCRLIPEFVASARLAPGRYTVPENRRQRLPALHNGEFELRSEHLRLLQAANWREIDGRSIDAVLDDDVDGQLLWPMPYIDGKRPYGDRSYYSLDMAQLLGQPFARDERGKFIIDPVKDQALQRLHKETLTALQVLFLYAQP